VSVQNRFTSYRFRNGCATGSGADTIMLPTGSTYTLARPFTDYQRNIGLSVITNSLAITANDSKINRKKTRRAIVSSPSPAPAV
jgi:hypothetical protein